MKLGMFVLSVVAFIHGASCGSHANNSPAPTKPQGHALAVGTWGGQHVRAEVSDRGVEIEFDCAQGNIAQKILLDAAGHFEVDGSFATQHGGPVRDDENNSRPVRYKGNVTDKDMELTVFDPKSRETIGTFTLRFGNEGRLMKCR